MISLYGIDNLVNILKKKEYFGVNVTYQLLNNQTLSAYEAFNTKAYTRLKQEGLAYFVTISPNMVFTDQEITFEKVNYSRILQETDKVIILNYIWGSYVGPPAPMNW